MTDLNTRQEQSRHQQEIYQQRYASMNPAREFQPGEHVYTLTYRRSGVHTVLSGITGDVYRLFRDGKRVKIHALQLPTARQSPWLRRTVMLADKALANPKYPPANTHWRGSISTPPVIHRRGRGQAGTPRPASRAKKPRQVWATTKNHPYSTPNRGPTDEESRQAAMPAAD